MLRKIIGFTVAGFIFASCATGPKYAELSPQQTETFMLAEETLREYKGSQVELGKAQDLYLKVLSENPKHSPSWLGLAKLVQRLGYYSGRIHFNPLYIKHSQQFIDTAEKHDPSSVRVAALRAKSFLFLNEMDNAKKWLEIAKNRNSKDIATLESEVLIEKAFKHFDVAVTAANRGLEVSKEVNDKINFLELKSDLFTDLKQFEQATQAAKEIAKLRPNDQWVVGNVAFAYQNARDWKNCEDWASKALSIQSYGMGRGYLRNCLIMQGKYDEALNIKWQAEKTKRAGEKMFDQRKYFTRFAPVLGTAPESQYREMYLGLVKEDENPVGDKEVEEQDALVQISYVLFHQNKPEEAINYVDRALKIDPKAIYPVSWKCQLLYSIPGKQESASAFMDTINYSLYTPAQQAQIYGYHASSYYNQKLFAKSVDVLKRWISSIPNDEMAHDRLYQVNVEQLKDLKGHEALYTAWVEKFPVKEVYHWASVAVLAGSQNANVAENYIENALAFDKDYAIAYYRMAYIKWGKQDWDLTETNFKAALERGLAHKAFEVRARVGLGQIYVYWGKSKSDSDWYEKAKEQYTMALALDPDNSEAKSGYAALMQSLAAQ